MNALILYGHQDPIGPAGGGQPFSRFFAAAHPYHEYGALASLSFWRDLTDDEQAATLRAMTETDRYWNDHATDAPKRPRAHRHVAVDPAPDGGYLVRSHDGERDETGAVEWVDAGGGATFEDALKAVQAALQLPR